ncbi:MAG TPA: hypothetical protein VNQ90_02780 [Chthoniobacteraceae bacterium]|nr:hypothetical protein [Chthoniobacteraceae bacterium]
MNAELPTSTIERKNLEYRFTNDELLGIAKKAAEEQTRLKSLEESKKMVMDEWKAKLSACQAEITNLSNKVSSGIEYRDYDCPVVYNEPRKGFKTCYHPETREVVYVKEMTQGEVDKTSQAVLDFDADSEATQTPSDGDAESGSGASFDVLAGPPEEPAQEEAEAKAEPDQAPEPEPEPEAPAEEPESKPTPKKPKRTRKPKAKPDAAPAPEEEPEEEQEEIPGAP